MNSELQDTDLKIGYRDRLGLAVINFVRYLNFKPSLELEEQQKTILRLQFAFYMERTRKFPIASKKYQELEDDNPNSLSDEMAFTLLHHGYCLVMMGHRDRAFVKLTKVRDLFPGTHYAENAALLISFIEENQKKKDDLKSKSKKPEELGGTASKLEVVSLEPPPPRIAGRKLEAGDAQGFASQLVKALREEAKVI